MIAFTTMFTNFVGSQMVKRRILHPKLLVLIAGVFGIGGTYLSSFITNWTIFRFLFPLSYGLAVGFAFMIHLYLAWKYVPGKEAIFTGIINSGFGAGGCLFTFISAD